MKLLSIMTQNGPRWGVLEQDRVRLAPQNSGPLQTHLGDLALISKILSTEPLGPKLSECKLLAPIQTPPQFIGVGLNYRDHAIEAGAPIPTSPITFGFLQTAIIGPGDAIIIPPFSSKVDWEAELGIVIGKSGTDISVEDAMDHVAGYVIINDVSERQVQFDEGQWGRSKSFNSFKPMGPWIVTQEELGDASNLQIQLWVNGVLKQSSTTSELIFGVREIVSRLSSSVTLLSGSVISTGTPFGIGHSRVPPEYLKSGDEVSIAIERLGTLVNPVS